RVDDRLAIERAVLRPVGKLARAEAILAADKEGNAFLQLILRCPQKSGKPAEVIVVPVTEDERIERTRVDFQKSEIVKNGLCRIAEVDQDFSRLVAGLRFRMHAQAPFAKQLVTGRPLWRFRTRKALHDDVRNVLRREIGKEEVVGNDAHGEAL